ncbi:hypothetical protein J7E62_07530 [Variovorax paradoxus]|nr:hypothetical protein [Variovorax paradoxus]
MAAAPRYLTIYGMRDVRVIESEAYRLLLSRPTPMSARMRPHLCNLSRWVCDVRESQAFGASPNLAVWTFEAEDVARLRAAEHASSSSGLLLARRARYGASALARERQGARDRRKLAPGPGIAR